MAELEFYEGASTGQQIDDVVQRGLVSINCGTITSLPVTITNANITAKHVCVGHVFGTPSAQNGRWKVATSEGSLTISGDMKASTSTTAWLFLARMANY